MSNSLWPHELQHARPPYPSPTPGVYSDSCPSSQWCHPAISSSVIPFSSCPQSLPASGSFPMSQLFAWGGKTIGVSASASLLPMNTQDWSPLGCMLVVYLAAYNIYSDSAINSDHWFHQTITNMLERRVEVRYVSMRLQNLHWSSVLILFLNYEWICIINIYYGHEYIHI